MRGFHEKLIAFLLCLRLMAPALPAQDYEILEGRSILHFYQTSGAINRGPCVRLLVDLLDGTVPKAALGAYPQVDNSYFADVSYDPPPLRAAGYGILEGSVESNGLRYAHADRSLARQEAAKLVVSLPDFFEQKVGYPLEPSGEPAVYADAGAIAGWALPFTQTIASYGLMRGASRETLTPRGSWTGPPPWSWGPGS